MDGKKTELDQGPERRRKHRLSARGGEGFRTWRGSALGAGGSGRAAMTGRVDLEPRPTRGEEAGGWEGSPAICSVGEETAGYGTHRGRSRRRHDERSCWRFSVVC